MNFLKSIFWNKSEQRLRTLFRIVLLILIAGIFASIISVASDSINKFLEKTFLNFLIMIAILGAIFIVGKFIDKRDWNEFGISIRPIRQFINGALLGLFLVSTIFFIQYLLGWISLNEIQYNSFPSYAFLIVFLGQVFRYLCGSIFEEAFSRGYLLLNLAEGFRGKLSTQQAVILSYFLTSSIFGILHFANDNATLLSSINLILIGLLLGWMVVKTRKLSFAIGLHAFWNIAQNNIYGFENSGKKSVASIFTFDNTGNTLWTGGEFGMEGGLICTLVVLLALLAMSYSEILGIKKFNQKIL